MIIKAMKEVCTSIDYLKEIEACITVLKEQVDMQASISSSTPSNLIKIGAVTSTLEEMKKLKNDIIKFGEKIFI